ncbi:MAG TPA: hypothetical protein VFH78_11100 [Candidatus Thermoplasmatota archaeon]|nr:hypothetical protein [Candidatus Thermoplasmatota archaeon]
MVSTWAAWELWAPGALAFAGVLGPSLLASRRVSLRTARALALAALAGALVLLLVAVFTAQARMLLFDLSLAGALVALAALGVRRAFAWALLVAAALASAKALAQARLAFLDPSVLGAALAGASGWAAAALLAISLCALRLRR